MRIIYHHRTHGKDAQGVHIVEMIQAFRRLGHEVTEVSLADPDPQKPEDAVREPLWRWLARKVPFSMEILQFGYNLFGFLLLCAAVLRARPDFIYERYALFNFAGVFVSRLFRIPLVLEVNSPLALEESGESVLRLQRTALRSEVFICNSATRVIAVTGVLASILIDSGVSPSRITVLHNGVSQDRFRPSPPDQQLRSALGLDNAFVFGFVGWFRRWHGLEMLIEAFALSGLADRSVKLLLVGSGPVLPVLQQAARRLNLAHAVVFSGSVPHAAVPSYMSLFDCAVQPAANAYCCPMKIIEYLAMAKAVIAPDQANIREIVQHGVEGLLFQPGDPRALASALLAVYQDPGLLAGLTAGASVAIARKRLFWTANAETVSSWFDPRC